MQHQIAGLHLLEIRLDRYDAAAIILVLIILSQHLSGYHISVLTTITIFSLAAMGLNLLSGNAGLISIAHAAFMGLGAFSAAWFVIVLGVPLLIASLLAGVVSAILRFIYAIP